MVGMYRIPYIFDSVSFWYGRYRRAFQPSLQVHQLNVLTNFVKFFLQRRNLETYREGGS